MSLSRLCQEGRQKQALGDRTGRQAILATSRAILSRNSGNTGRVRGAIGRIGVSVYCPGRRAVSTQRAGSLLRFALARQFTLALAQRRSAFRSPRSPTRGLSSGELSPAAGAP